jgi:hypothetical protein
MFTRHISRNLAAYLDGQLAPPEVRQTERHLRQCPQCKADYEEITRGMEIIQNLPSAEAPEAIWKSIEAAFQKNPSPQKNLSATMRAVHPWRWAFVASLILALAVTVYWRLHPSGPTWEVVRIDGSIRGVTQIGAGEWIETKANSRATVKIGDIGSVEISPRTLLRVVTARPDEHRLALARGEIRATISAPPRLFFVDTPSGTAVDLGCEYALNTDEHGFGLLRVTKGWVSFQWNGLESLVPAGASCPTRPRNGPGIPYFDDAPETIKRALAGFGFEKDGSNTLNILLTESRVRDTLTLWHLLSRVDVVDRARVYDRMAALTPVPAGVSRDRALNLDPETLKTWKEELAWTW